MYKTGEKVWQGEEIYHFFWIKVDDFYYGKATIRNIIDLKKINTVQIPTFSKLIII